MFSPTLAHTLGRIFDCTNTSSIYQDGVLKVRAILWIEHNPGVSQTGLGIDPFADEGLGLSIVSLCDGGLHAHTQWEVGTAQATRDQNDRMRICDVPMHSLI